MREFATVFLALIFETTPFLLAGVLVSVILGPVVERALASAAFRQPVVGMAAGVGAGMLLPMCDCGSRPLAHRLALAGRREFAMAFLVAAPVINPIVVVATWLAFRDMRLLILRLGITALMAIATAFVLARVQGEVAVPEATADHDHAGEGWRSIPGHVLTQFFELFQYLVVGSALAAVIQLYVSQSSFLGASGVFLPILALMGLAFLLSICSSVDGFVMAGLARASGLARRSPSLPLAPW